ncbi:hypothetical protein RhiirA1_481209 [Rhizophagus irregularis]|uniref:Uncharacterized protein n=2 Tax=Rhizophagus irregularis TaxID=588596 RepID=U9TSC1_RHIID|nr:hypothetical protein GLOIN_2v1772333 [Rhizophagus irregularis DAOM 181602=DAOM 197198]PKC52569.1 hypothetical protein RhiirA1_481209 [Rhizophagus irregularis]POG73670.1 hypothetical protein GLOIN_2v1772333 [Rhizophagus irregularis DAOM 181602=DAOM 197198]|eukprot:XP_025180536.1 hypothetical protein GLOIN_2v1772333 [Rhizophagus irregularis DAOM 181602=DAOM 197198]
MEVKNAVLKVTEKLKKYYKYTNALFYTITTSMLFFYLENKYIEAAQKNLNILYKTKYTSTKNMMILDEYSENSLLQYIYKRQYLVNNNELNQYLATSTAPYGTDILQ